MQNEVLLADRINNAINMLSFVKGCCCGNMQNLSDGAIQGLFLILCSIETDLESVKNALSCDLEGGG